jgi:hypothetical protein
MWTSSTNSRFFLRFFGLLLGIIFLLADASLSNWKGRTGASDLYLSGEGRRWGEPLLRGAAARPCRLRDASGLSEHGEQDV